KVDDRERDAVRPDRQAGAALGERAPGRVGRVDAIRLDVERERDRRRADVDGGQRRVVGLRPAAPPPAGHEGGGKADGGPGSALDGEIVITRDGKLDFDAMQMRLQPAESRIRKLSGEIPATFVAFDLLLWQGKKLHEQPIEQRRAELERVAEGFALSPVAT